MAAPRLLMLAPARRFTLTFLGGLTVLTSALLMGPTPTRAQVERQTTASDVRMTINNLGLIGNGFRNSFFQGLSSCEYPARSGIEHLFGGGLWVGARVDGATFVSSGAIDNSVGYVPGACNFEFTTTPNRPVEQISSLVRSPGYNPLAVSHQDFITEFTDRNTVVPGTQIVVNRDCANRTPPDAQHRPLGLNIRLAAYNWSFSFANFFVILNYEVRNVGTDTLRDVAYGLWGDGVVRNIRRTRPGGTPFFDKGGNGYMDSLYLAYEFDAAGDLGFTESYIGLKFLGLDYTPIGAQAPIFLHPDRPADSAYRANFPNIRVLYNSWRFNSIDPNFFTPNSEAERYLRLTTGLNEREGWPELQRQLRQPQNRSSLISVAGQPRLAPGERANVVFAVVMARKREDGRPNVDDTETHRANLRQNANWAQITFNGEDQNFNGILDPGEDVNEDGRLTRYTLPAPPDTPLMRVEAVENGAILYWADNAERSIDPISRQRDFRGYRIYRSRFGFDQGNVQDIAGSLELYKQFDLLASQDRKPFLEPLPPRGEYRFEGDSTVYQYRLAIPGLPNGWQHALALTAYDSGNVATRLQPLETSALETLVRVFPGTRPNTDMKARAPYAYPNPYYGSAAWEGNTTRPEERKLYFANLPNRARITILTQSGDLIDQFTHEGDTYRGQDAAWFAANTDPAQVRMSGGERAWDLLSRSEQIVARGTYLFTVEDLDSGRVSRGTFTIIR